MIIKAKDYKKCLHCGEKSNFSANFCCSGCEHAYEIINKSGLKNYYKNRQIDSDEKSLKPDNNICEVDIESFVQKEGDVFSINLMVEGIHCASCVWLIESILNKQDSTISARVNMSTRRLVLKWQGSLKDGNKLINLVASLGYRLVPFDFEMLKSSDAQKAKKLMRAIAVSGFAMSNVMLISVALWSSDSVNMGQGTRAFFHFLSLVIAMPAILYAGRPFFASAISALKEKRTNMDVPISVGVLLTAGVSAYQTFYNGEHIYFESAIMLLFFLLIGRYLDIKAKGKAQDAASRMFAMMAGSATIIKNGVKSIIAVKKIEEGMVLSVAKGERIAVDGVLQSSNAQVDASIITGESLPQNLHEGENVFAGMINVSDAIKVYVSKKSDKSLISDILKMIENAEQGQAKYVRLADRISRFYTPVVHFLALFSFLLWVFVFNSSVDQAILNSVAVLIITCPCALGLAVPVVQVLASGNLLKKGIMLKKGDALERLAQVDMICFDKTGTLTTGNLKLLNSDKFDEKTLQIAASIASVSKHPLSKALCAEYKGDLLDLTTQEIAGKGLCSRVNDVEVKLGSRIFCGVSDDEGLSDMPEIWLNIQGQEPIQFCFEDDVRTDAKQIVEEILKQEIIVNLLSGDRANIVANLAKKIGVMHYFSHLSPQEKFDFINRKKSEKYKILMVGDGLNDAPSLAASDVSMSPSTAIDISQNAADIVFQGEKLKPVLTALNIAKKSQKLIKENFAFAFAYNAIAVPFAVAGYVTPLVAAIAMSLSSIIVILNSFRINAD